MNKIEQRVPFNCIFGILTQNVLLYSKVSAAIEVKKNFYPTFDTFVFLSKIESHGGGRQFSFLLRYKLFALQVCQRIILWPTKSVNFNENKQ